MDDNSNLVKLKKYDNERINNILESTSLFKVSHEPENILYVKKDNVKEVNITINTINFFKPHVIYVKEEGIELVGSEYSYFPYHKIKSLVIDSNRYIYASSLENESIINIKELKIIRKYILALLIIMIGLTVALVFIIL